MPDKCHVLIAEDDDFLREKIAGVLSRLEYISAVSQVSDMNTLAAMVEKYVPTIVLVDLKLATGNKALINELRHKHDGMRIFFMNENDTKLPCAEKIDGADGCFFKQNIVSEVHKLVEKECSEAGLISSSCKYSENLISRGEECSNK